MKKIICGIYKIANPKGHIYIGQGADIYNSRWNTYEKLYCKGQRRLYYSLKKYGWDAHTKEVIHKCPKEELDKWEIYYIKKFDCFNTEHGLNLTSGGSNGCFSREAKLKIANTRIRNRGEGRIGVSIAMWVGLKKALEKAAKESKCSISEYIKRLVIRDLQKHENICHPSELACWI